MSNSKTVVKNVRNSNLSVTFPKLPFPSTVRKLKSAARTMSCLLMFWGRSTGGGRLSIFVSWNQIIGNSLAVTVTDTPEVQTFSDVRHARHKFQHFPWRYIFLLISDIQLQQITPRNIVVAPLKCKSLKHLQTQNWIIHNNKTCQQCLVRSVQNDLSVLYLSTNCAKGGNQEVVFWPIWSVTHCLHRLNQSDKMSQTVTPTIQNDP